MFSLGEFEIGLGITVLDLTGLLLEMQTVSVCLVTKLIGVMKHQDSTLPWVREKIFLGLMVLMRCQLFLDMGTRKHPKHFIEGYTQA